MNKNRVLAINTFFPRLSGNALWDRLRKVQGSFEDVPVGLLSILSVLEYRGNPVLYLELNSPRRIRVWQEEVRRAIHEFQPTIILIPGYYTVKYPAALRIASFVKQLDPKLLVVTGGVHVSGVKEQVFKDSKDIDVVVLYEGEWSVQDLVHCYDGTLASVKQVGGTMVRIGEEITTTPSLTPGNLEDLPPLNYGLLDRVPAFVPIITQRGCAFRCKFCAEFGYFGKKVKHFPVPRMMREIRLLSEKYGVRGIGIEDSMFGLKTKYFNEFFEAFEKERFTKVQDKYMLTRADSITEDGLKILQRLGFAVCMGIESASPRVLKAMDKRITFPQCEEALAMFSDVGIRSVTFWIMGLPGSSIEDEEISRKAAVKLASSRRSHVFETATFVPYPGTETFDRRDEFGIEILDWRWERWGRWGGVRPISQLKNFKRHEIMQCVSKFNTAILAAGGRCSTASVASYSLAAVKRFVSGTSRV